MLGYFIDQVPFWVWVVLTGVTAAAVFYFLSPILVPLWTITPKWVKITIGAIGAFIATVLYSRKKGADSVRAMQAKRDAQAVQTRTEVHDKVSKYKDTDLDDKLNRTGRLRD